jgi:hypothetical protein
MTRCTHRCHTLMPLIGMLLTLLGDDLCFLFLCLRSRSALAAENRFLRKQLALYQERQVKPGRATYSTRIALIWLARWFDWQLGLAVVQPATLIRWHRQGFRLWHRIPLTENHLRHLLQAWVRHDQEGRPHMALDPGIPQLPASLPALPQDHRYRLPAHLRVAARPILGGLHQEGRLGQKAA